jgi:transposase-like protein
VAEALDIHPFMLSRWRKEHREGKFAMKRVKNTERLHSALGYRAPMAFENIQ